MAIEAAFVKPIVDVVLAALKRIKGVKVKRDAAAELNEVIRNLLLINHDEGSAEAKIQAAKAAGVISKELILAEKMLSLVRAKPRAVLKKAAAKPAAKRPAAKKPAAKKPSAKRPLPKPAAVVVRKPSARVRIKISPQP